MDVGRRRRKRRGRTVRERKYETESINHMNDTFMYENNRKLKAKSKNEVNEHKNKLCNKRKYPPLFYPKKILN